VSLERDWINAVLLDRYVVERELGRGGMATVYAARDMRHNRLVALKVLHADLAAGVGVERFRGEIEIASALAHPGILPVFDSGGSGHSLFYVMPYIEGESLRGRLLREGRLPLDQALRIAGEVGEALAYAHARDIVHRDIKPENILLVDGRPVIADFGIARAIVRASANNRLTVPGVALGTPLYMSPEQASGEQHVDGRSDVYSLGCVLYEMLAGIAPHHADTPRDVLARKLTPDAFAPPLERLDAPPEVRAVVARALASHPEDRFSTAAEFVAAIGAAASLAHARSSGTLTRRPTPAAVRRARRPILLGSVVLLLLAAGWWRVSRTPLASDDGRVAIAVLPFRATMPSAAQWTEALPDLLATALDGTPGVRVVDPWALWRPLRATPNAAPHAPAPREAARLARDARACCYVLGSVALLGDELDVTLRLYRRGEDDPMRTMHAAASRDSLPGLVRQLALQLIGSVSRGEAPALARADQGLTRSPDALKAWLVAREMRRRGDLDSALTAIDRAIALDSSFVLALIDAVSIHSWVQSQRGQPYEGLRALAERAVRHGDSLPERPRLRARAMLASINTDGTAAAEALARILAIDSTDVDAWSLLTYIRIAYGWQFGADERQMLAAAERTLLLDSTDATALVRRATLAASANDPDDLARQLRRMRAADTTVPLVRGQIAAVRALQASDSEFRVMLDSFGGRPSSEWIPVLRLLRNFRPARAEEVAMNAYRTSTLQDQRAGLGALVQLLSAESRWSVVDSLTRAGALAEVPGFDRQVDRFRVAAAISGTAEDAGVRAAAARLEATMRPDSALAWFARRPVWLEGWLIGAYEAMYGDTTLARRWGEALGSLPEGGSPRRFGAALAADVAARLAGRRGDRTTALARADEALRLWDVHPDLQFEFTPEPAMRFHLAELLESAGRTDSAAVLFRSLVPPTTWMGFYTARASLELGEILEARGDRTEALRHYLTAQRAWERGDASIAALRERARKGLDRLRS
jgi:tetratricopeptide (TPR) repeat protein